MRCCRAACRERSTRFSPNVSWNPALRRLLGGDALALLAGCATPAPKGPPLTGDPLIDGPRLIQEGPPRDKMLWQYRTALAALDRGQYETARSYLDDAIARLNGMFGKDADAKKARGLFNEEAKKGFIGEPYERAMAYYYRGIIYWRDGEPDNARACFRSAEFMDSDTEEKTYAGDYVVADYLDGYITDRLSGDGSDARKRAEASAKMWKPPHFTNTANVLVFVDYGGGPKKYATGPYGEQLRFRCAGSPIRSALVKIDQATGRSPLRRLMLPGHDPRRTRHGSRAGQQSCVQDHDQRSWRCGHHQRSDPVCKSRYADRRPGGAGRGLVSKIFSPQLAAGRHAHVGQPAAILELRRVEVPPGRTR
jgi:hypothetical protein